MKNQYRDFELPLFNKPTGAGIVKRLEKEFSCRGDRGVSVANRLSLPTWSTNSESNIL
ncbi:Hypothetical predicted protein, partial [Paramuricea clavata]